MSKHTPKKTKKEALAVKNLLLAEAKKLHQLAQDTEGAQLIVMGGASTKQAFISFNLGWVTTPNKLMMIANLLRDCDADEFMAITMAIASGQITCKGPK